MGDQQKVRFAKPNTYTFIYCPRQGTDLYKIFFEHRCSSTAYLKFFASKVKSKHVIYVCTMNRTFDKILK